MLARTVFGCAYRLIKVGRAGNGARLRLLWWAKCNVDAVRVVVRVAICG